MQRGEIYLASAGELLQHSAVLGADFERNNKKRPVTLINGDNVEACFTLKQLLLLQARKIFLPCNEFIHDGAISSPSLSVSVQCEQKNCKEVRHVCVLELPR